jgi:hypothetical protein
MTTAGARQASRRLLRYYVAALAVRRSTVIRLTNEDVIDLYNRAPKGAKVVVLATTRWRNDF